MEEKKNFRSVDDFVEISLKFMDVSNHQLEEMRKCNEHLIDEMDKKDRRMHKTKRIKYICLTVMLTLVLGFFSYIASTFELSMSDTIETTYDQSADGESNIINGNQFNDSASNNESPKEK